MKSQALIPRLSKRALLAGLFFGVVSSPNLLARVSDEVFPSPIQKIFVPGQYDSNDNIQIGLQGAYTNTCLHEGKTGFSINMVEGIIKLWAESNSSLGSGVECLEAERMFMQVVEIGSLAAGDYTVEYEGQPELERPLHVAQSTMDTPDEHLYAPVDYVRVDSEVAEPSFAVTTETDLLGRARLTLVGTFPYLYVGCMHLAEVALERDPSDVLIVKPIAVVSDDGCSTKHDIYKFEHSVELPEDLAKTMLIHIRLPDGAALNRLLVTNGKSSGHLRGDDTPE